jgi:2-desacetyl-2-hydroxyethyl bacteriochlorophyllide A dehydrogenase
MDNVATGRAVWFTAERRAEVLEEQVQPAGPDDITVEAEVSMVSTGTEMLIYRGLLPAEDDLGLETCEGSFGFPVKYAYQTVGRVVDAGADSGFTVGERVFCRHPHQSLFTMRVNPMLAFKVPETLAPDRAIFANLLDVALNANLDVPVRHGDAVVVYGFGIVGSLIAQLAAATAGEVVVVEPGGTRQDLARSMGFTAVAPDAALDAVMSATRGRGVDVAFEASGAAAAPQSAIHCTGQEGTIAVLSFFGSQQVPLVLSPEFHYRRQRIISSQVSTLGSGLQPRWDMERRMNHALAMLQSDTLTTPVTHRYAFDDAPKAYQSLDADLPAHMGVLLEHQHGA